MPVTADTRGADVVSAAAERDRGRGPGGPGSAAESVIAGWRQYLLAERGMVPGTVRGYTDLVRPFLDARDDGERVLLDGTGARDVNAFMLENTGKYALKTLQRLASGLRSFFAWAFMTGLMSTDLSGAVPVDAVPEVPAPGPGPGDARRVRPSRLPGTGRSCCCCGDSACAVARWPGGGWPTSTGVPRRSA